MVEIRVSPERLRSAASDLARQQADVDSLFTSMRSMVEGLSGEWAGMAQIDYTQTFNDQVPKMQSQVNEILENLMQALRRIADEFETTDQNAA